jgi:hypothetical protein
VLQRNSGSVTRNPQSLIYYIQSTLFIPNKEEKKKSGNRKQEDATGERANTSTGPKRRSGAALRRSCAGL